MSSIPPDDYEGHDQFIYIATNNQPTQLARRGRSLTVRRGKEGKSAAEAAAFTSNNP
jgi:hypothetical protein